jgi:hypothetical protein
MKTPLTDAACFSATTEKPSSGDFELEVVDSKFARDLEGKLDAANARITKLELAARVAVNGIKPLILLGMCSPMEAEAVRVLSDALGVAPTYEINPLSR